MGVGGIFSRGGGALGDFSKIFPWGVKVVKYDFSHWKLRKQYFLLRISKFWRGIEPSYTLSDAHGSNTEICTLHRHTCCRDDLGQRSFIDFCTVQAELRSRKESVVFGWSQSRFRRKLGVGVRFFYPNTDILRKGGSHGISKKGSTQVIHFPLPTLFAKWRLLVWPGDIYTSFTREKQFNFLTNLGWSWGKTALFLDSMFFNLSLTGTSTPSKLYQCHDSKKLNKSTNGVFRKLSALLRCWILGKLRFIFKLLYQSTSTETQVNSSFIYNILCLCWAPAGNKGLCRHFIGAQTTLRSISTFETASVTVALIMGGVLRFISLAALKHSLINRNRKPTCHCFAQKTDFSTWGAETLKNILDSLSSPSGNDLNRRICQS